ncbi:hypothetical protein ANCCAN_08295 [Ancylostoma caninum]|uniref:Uncharacterized protein n=1 Tax=Ancylostoma caninum TaxID=29170 RepID=A0A368GS14_ANCCA|nr:hypothetical protein ANCCAN_08295 [Ancylostoma caninum]
MSVTTHVRNIANSLAPISYRKCVKLYALVVACALRATTGTKRINV